MSDKLGGSLSKEIQIVFGIPLLAVGDRKLFTTFLVDVPINRSASEEVVSVDTGFWDRRNERQRIL